MREFKEWEKQLLLALADTFIASDSAPKDALDKIKGSELLDMAIVEKMVSRQPLPFRTEFFQLLGLLNSPMLGFTWPGPWKKFVKLNPAQREEMLYAWSQSNILKLRKAFLSLKKLLIFPSYGAYYEGGNPAWPVISYPGPLSEPPIRRKPITTLHAAEGEEIICDILVIGSGAGGGVIAGELAKSGWDVVVVEKGPYFSESDFNQRELEMITSLYDQAGAIASRDGSITLMAGSCLGGGTTINWAGSFKTPDYIREEWAKEHQVPFFAQNSYDLSLEAVCEKLGVSTDYQTHNNQNRALWDGSEKLGHKISWVPRNEAIPADNNFNVHGYSCFGDQYGLKKGTLKTYLQDAFDAGARFYAQTYVQKIDVELGEAKGAQAVQTLSDGRRIPFQIKAKRIFVCAGAIHSPALLIRSGLVHPQIGRNLHLHPTMAVSGLYDKAMAPWFGPMMSAVNDQFNRLSGNYGVKIETPPAHPGLLSMALPWSSAKQHKGLLRKAKNMGHFVVITRDKFSGRIRLTPKGNPVIDYKLHSYDRNHLLKGLAEAGRIHLEAGASEIYFGHNSCKVFSASEGINRYENFTEGMGDWGWKSNQFLLMSAHQMATCRMGGSEKHHPIKPNGETREVRNLFVADASAFPSASGANPMISIMAIAHHIAQELKY